MCAEERLSAWNCARKGVSHWAPGLVPSPGGKGRESEEMEVLRTLDQIYPSINQRELQNSWRLGCGVGASGKQAGQDRTGQGNTIHPLPSRT